MSVELSKFGKRLMDYYKESNIEFNGIPVTGRIRMIKQPYGGYLPVKSLNVIELNYDNYLISSAKESVAPNLVGLAVDYLTRYMLTGDKEKAFFIALKGIDYIDELSKIYKEINNNNDWHLLNGKDRVELAKESLDKIKGLDDESIYNAICLSTFDAVYRRGAVNQYYFIKNNVLRSERYHPDPEWGCLHPDVKISRDTCINIRRMVQRSLKFFEEYGPIICDGFTFEPNGYTKIVNAGDGDFLTKNTLWDFKVSSNKPTSKQTLQILMYYIMGKHSGNSIFDEITNIGIYNPRLNTVYLKSIDGISSDVIDEVSREVIGYE